MQYFLCLSITFLLAGRNNQMCKDSLTGRIVWCIVGIALGEPEAVDYG